MNKTEQIKYLKSFIKNIEKWFSLYHKTTAEDHKNRVKVEDKLSAQWGVVEPMLESFNLDFVGTRLLSGDGKTSLKPITYNRFSEGFIKQVNSHKQFVELEVIKSLSLQAAERLKTEFFVATDILPGVNLVVNILNEFPSIVSRWKYRRKGKDQLKIDDEYDVQDILYTMLKGTFPTLQYEDPNSKVGANSSIIDFKISDLGLFIEVKHIASKGKEKKVQEECKQDIVSYSSQENCKKIIFFIYDPNKTIDNVYAFENSLGKTISKDGKHVEVTVIIKN